MRPPTDAGNRGVQPSRRPNPVPPRPTLPAKPGAERQEQIAQALHTSIKGGPWYVFPKNGGLDYPVYEEARLDLSRHAVRCVLAAVFGFGEDDDQP